MGWFSSTPDTPADPIRPVTIERIAELFDRENWQYVKDDDGTIGGRWGEVTAVFHLGGTEIEVLQVVCRCIAPMPEERLDELRVFIEDWHRDRLWPKCYHEYDEDGALRLAGEVNIDHQRGASDAQLFLHIKCAIGCMNQLADSAYEVFGLAPTP